MALLLERMLLHFRDPQLERAWRIHADDDARLPVRVGLLVFGVLVVLAGLGDKPQGYDGWQDILLIRLLVWGPLLLVGAGLVSLSTMRGRVLDIALSVALLLTLSLVYVAWFVLPAASATTYPMYWTVLLLLVHVVAPLGLVRATVAGAAIVAGFFATMLHHGAPSLHFAAHTTFILFAWIQLIAASWLLESRARRAFLAQRRVQARTRELDAVTRLQASVLDTLIEGVCGLNAEGVVTFANRAAGLLLGRPIGAIIGSPFHASFHDDDDDDGSGSCALCASSIRVNDVPARLRLPGGGVRWVECASEPGGGVRVLSFRDVGRRRELEAQVRHSQKMEAIGVFVGGVAHEFNNLLTPIVGGVELATQVLGPDHPLDRSLTDIGRAGDRAAALVRQLLALARRTEITPQSVDISSAVAQALVFIRPSLDRRIDLMFESGPAAWAHADPGQVRQVLLNLCLNARDALWSVVDANIDARIEISVRRVDIDAAAVELSPSSHAGAWIELCVADSGHGIPPDMLSRMFEPFFTTRSDRSGLGLAVLHGIVYQHGGWVSVDTSPGQGARFRCMFPATEPPASTEPDLPVVGGRATLTETRSALLVDDEEMVRDVTRTILEIVGYTVEECSSGFEALSRLEAGYRPDVIVLDILMPGLDGWRTLAGIRGIDPTIPVVMMSGYDASTGEPRSSSPDAYLRKPFRIEELVGTLDQAVARAGKA